MRDEAITKEFKSVYCHVDDFRLGRVQRKASVGGPRSYLGQGGLGICESLALNH